jgi:hypothetical protein
MHTPHFLLTLTLSVALAPIGAAVDTTLLDDLKTTRPRIIIDPSEEQGRIARLAAGTAPRLTAHLDLLDIRATTQRAAPALTRTIIDGRLLDVSRNLFDRTLTLGTLWRLRGDTASRDRLISDLLTVCAFSDWNPSHFLDVAEMTAGVGLGYDWLYDVLTAGQRATLSQAIRSKGLTPGNQENLWWVSTTNNWNQVCHAGLSIGALAVAEDDRPLALAILDRAKRKHAIALTPYDPDGVYPEGPGWYWPYGTNFTGLLDQALVTAANLDWGIWNRQGLIRSFAYARHATGTTGLAFNYADGGELPILSTAAPWVALRTNDPGLATWAWDQAPTSRPSRLDGLLAHVDEPATTPPAALPTTWVGRGDVEIACIRSAWTADATYLGLKGGKLAVNHGHLDAGSFVLEVAGQRFGSELPPDDQIYSLGLWDLGQNSDRWDYLRVNNRGHNVLLIGNGLQSVASDSPVAGPYINGARSSAVVTTTAAYGSSAATARRGAAVLTDGTAVIQDECTGIGATTAVTWQMYTQATATVAGDGRSVTLVRNGTSAVLWLAEAPANVAFAAISPPPVPAGQIPLTGWTRIQALVPAPVPQPLRLVVAANQAQTVVPMLALDDWDDVRALQIGIDPDPGTSWAAVLTPGGGQLPLVGGSATFEPLARGTSHDVVFVPVAAQ